MADYFSDIENQPLMLGDRIAYIHKGRRASSSYLRIGYIIGFTDAMVRVGDAQGEFRHNRNPDNMIILKRNAINVVPQVKQV